MLALAGAGSGRLAEILVIEHRRAEKRIVGKGHAKAIRLTSLYLLFAVVLAVEFDIHKVESLLLGERLFGHTHNTSHTSAKVPLNTSAGASNTKVTGR